LQDIPNLASLELISSLGMQRRPPEGLIVRDLASVFPSIPFFDAVKDSSCKSHVAEYARDKIEPFPRVESMAVERDRGAKAACGCRVTPEVFLRIRGEVFSSHKPHKNIKERKCFQWRDWLIKSSQAHSGIDYGEETDCNRVVVTRVTLDRAAGPTQMNADRTRRFGTGNKSDGTSWGVPGTYPSRAIETHGCRLAEQYDL
jgi:hypothetical protein